MGEPICTVCRKGKLVLGMASLNVVLLVSSCLQISPQWNNFPSECLHIWEWKTGLAPKCPWPQLPPLITILQLPQPDILGPKCLYLITSPSKPTENSGRGLVQGGHHEKSNQARQEAGGSGAVFRLAAVYEASESVLTTRAKCTKHLTALLVNASQSPWKHTLSHWPI